MDLVFRHIAVEGFRSFRRDTVFTLPGRPGFYLMGGKNLVNPEMGANAVGKSSLWDALCWCLYGKTARGQTAGDVANWERDEVTSVAVLFRARGREYTLTRTWRPNSLVLERRFKDPRPVDQRQVDELLGLDHTAFLHTVLMGQFGTLFFDLGSAEKLQLFSDALGLGVWLRAADKAKERAKALADRVQQEELVLARLRGNRETLQGQLENAKEQARLYKEHAKQELGKAKRHLEDLKTALFLQERALELRRTDAEKWQRRLGKRQRMADGAATSLRKAMEAERSARAAVSDAQVAQRRLQDQRKRAEELSGKCPTCFQHVKDATKDAVLAEWDRQIEWEKGEEHRHAKAMEECRTLVAKCSTVACGADREAQTAKAALQRADAELRKAEGETAVQRRVVQHAAKAVEDLRSGKNPHEVQVWYATKQLAATRRQIKDKKDELDALSRRQKRAEFWARGFKEVRLLVVEEALAELEVEVCNALDQLGLEGWRVEFDVERETKAGTVTRGFNVFVQAPDSPRQVPWKSWCGGETQRLRVAGALGFANLICNRKGVRPSAEVWDEPTNFLSEEGVQDLLTFFEGRGREEQKQVWLIDHRSFLHGGFDGTVTIVKDKKGSKILQKVI
jgi:DNA repair exonuclease SbcCD ATPase subunit